MYTRLNRFLKLLPLFIILATVFSLNSLPAAATNTPLAPSITIPIKDIELLDSTNTKRLLNNLAPLSLDSKLNNAAQDKANDMVMRNYWDHNTPDNLEPWVFITKSGYNYKTAGENLAYGFDNGVNVITGWMNSPAHRHNLLNNNFSNVGFGLAESDNFIQTGKQTIIVAMYASPN